MRTALHSVVPSSLRVGLIAAASTAAALVSAASASAATPAPATSSDWQVIAQGLVEFDAGDRQWTVERVDVAAGTPLAIEVSDPTFVLAAGGASFVGFGDPTSRLLPGEATFATGEATVTPASGDTSSVEVLRLAGAQADNSSTPVALTEGVFEVELWRDVLAPGEMASLPSGLPALVLVTAGSVTDNGGVEFEAGTRSTFVGEATLTASSDAPAAVVAAIVTPVEAVPEIDEPAASESDNESSPAPSTSPSTAPSTSPSTAPSTSPSTAPPTTAPATTAPATTAAPVDSDGDGLTDDEEVGTWGSDPTTADSDGDGLSDGDEVNRYGSSPTATDSDADGIGDADEVLRIGSSPSDFDSDGDELDDYVEWTAYLTSPIAADTDGDLDNDGYEVRMGTDPLDSTDFTR